MIKLAVVTTHPIQYYAPLFRLLNERNKIAVKVFYTWEQSNKGGKYDPGFGKIVEWDIPLLDGYEYEFLKNIAKHPGSHHFRGINNPTIIESIKQYNPDKILVFGWNYMSHMRVLRYFKKKVPVYFRGDSTLINEKAGLNRIMRRFWLRWVYSFIDFAFYVGSKNKEYFVVHGLKENQLIYAPHVIDTHRFKYEEIDLNSEKENEQVTFLFVGKLDNNKNTELLIKAFMALGAVKAILRIVGDGELMNELKKYQSERIIFEGFKNQSELKMIYNSADVLILPSKNETWGLVINEAMTCGLAVIASDGVGGAYDLIEHGVNGFVFASGSKEQLKEYMLYIIENSSRLSLMKKASVTIIGNWSIDRLVESMENKLLS